MSDNFFDITIPDLGEDIKEVTIVDWLKNKGEQIHAGEPLLEVMTDKANIEVESPATGILYDILYEKDAIVTSGDKVGVLETRN
jgi:pyruvate/2-oxoglutarate dehydrogenase complex dihydrolipoamide acyltransferase (E2) component